MVKFSMLRVSVWVMVSLTFCGRISQHGVSENPYHVVNTDLPITNLCSHCDYSQPRKLNVIH